MTRAVTTVRIINNKSSVPPLSLNLSQTAPIYRVALTSGQLALVGSGGAGGYTYSATGLPAGLSLNTATGSITGTPTTIGHNVITATVTDSATNSFTATFSIDVLTRLVVVNALSFAVEQGIAVSQQMSVTGATGAVSYALASGSFPPGLSISSAGLISGMPTYSGTLPPSVAIPIVYFAAVTASDSGTGDTLTFQLTASEYLKFGSWGGLHSTPYYTGVEYAGISLANRLGLGGGGPNQAWTIDVSAMPSGTTVSGNAVTFTAANAGTFTTAYTIIDSLGGTVSGNVDFVVVTPNVALQPQQSTVAVGPAGPSNINFEFPSSGTPDVANDGTTMTVTIPTVAGPAGPTGHGSTTTTAAPTASGGNWVFTVADTTAFNAAGLPIYCSDGTNSIRGHVVSVASSTQLTVAPDSTSGTVTSIANGSTFTFSGVAGPTGPAGGGGGGGSGTIYFP